MSKHKNKGKKKKNNNQELLFESMISTKSKKSINKDFKDVLKEIEASRIELYEVDKRLDKRKRKQINRDERDFLNSMDAIKTRKKMSKKWKKTGLLDRVINLLNEISPMVKIIAKSFAIMIVAFLSIEEIQKHIPIDILSKITHAFDLAMAI